MHVNTETHFTKHNTLKILVEYEKGFDMTTGKIKIDPYATGHPPTRRNINIYQLIFKKSKGQPGGHLKPHDTRSTRLQELSLMN